MNGHKLFLKPFFLILSILFSTAYTTTTLGEGVSLLNVGLGIGLGLVLGATLMSLNYFFRNTQLRTFNTALLGLFFGYLMGEAILLILTAIIDAGALQLNLATMGFMHAAVFLFSSYTAMNLVAGAADEIYVCLPFVKFKPTNEKKKDVLLDSSILLDHRLIDLAASGLLDQHLIIPRFTLKELNNGLESYDDTNKAKSRRGLETLKKLDDMPTLGLRYIDTDFTDIKDPTSKLIRLARMNDANIFTADMNKIQQSAHEGVKIINIHSLSNALKPITQTGEYINIKIQRYGKEPRQGVGYLDDGTMVVINGGAEYIGETIKAQVLSVKHTTSGRMIFCNAAEHDSFLEDESALSLSGAEHNTAFAASNLDNPQSSYSQYT